MLTTQLLENNFTCTNLDGTHLVLRSSEIDSLAQNFFSLMHLVNTAAIKC